MSKARTRQEKTDTSNTKAEAIECRRCGVCCSNHQAFVNPEDIERIVTYLGITMDDWDRFYDDSRWQFSEYRLIRHVNGACAFLSYDKGVATCEIHAVKPACCTTWKPGPDRPECREGIRLNLSLASKRPETP